MGGIAVISNPRSGVNKRNPELLQRLAYVLGDQGELAQPPDLDNLEDTIRNLRYRYIDIVCVNGGDGTLHKVVSALVRVYTEGAEGAARERITMPKVAILKSGTVNTLARNIGLKMPARPFLGTIVDTWHGKGAFRTVERNALVVNGGESSGFLFGTGVLSRFMEAYYAGGTTGVVKALRVLARGVLSAMLGTRFARDLFARDHVTVTVDGRTWKAQDGYAAVAVGTTNDLGLGFRLFHAAKSHPDHLHVLGFPCGPMAPVSRLHRVYLGQPMQHPEIYDQVAKGVVIDSPVPVSYMIDGDFVAGQHKRLTVEVGPRVRFIVP